MRLLVVSKIDPTALRRLRAEHHVVVHLNPDQERLATLIGDREVLIFRSGVTISPSVLDRAPHLRLLIRAGSGFDNVDLDDLAHRGIGFERIPGPGAQSVAELTFAHLLVLARNLLAADQSMRAGRWPKAELTGCMLAGKTLGVVGLGAIGTHVARMGKAWGMRPIGCVGRPSVARAEHFAARGIRLADLDEVLRTADFVSVHVPLQTSTAYLLDRRALSMLKPTAFLVNASRGGVVDEAALYEALRKGQLAGAGLDVHAVERDGHTSPLAELPNVVLTPHIGASTADAQREIGLEIIRIVTALAHATVEV